MEVVIIGISGAVGGLLAERLLARGDTVRGLVRREAQRTEWERRGAEVVVGELADWGVPELAALLEGADAVVYAAGSNGGHRDVTTAVDGEGVARAAEAARVAGVDRFLLVSVLPESWRERELGEEVEYYFAVKKAAEVALVRTGLDWLVLRPALLTDDPAAGTVSLGPAELHEQVSRADVATVLAALVHQPRIRRRILELNQGTTPVEEAVSDVGR
ncbi:NAD(P)H-binding protein [Auraticoccus monumenti]|uniref:NAD(P)H-binding n=1 Tax=Auraticoccus monumenti TaxID=675864 RepID=A0A1G6S7P6_9ACTN|nr:NAD(P)H-binding protein [Auraticoccus monumenti]SDD12147.1 NAD(P)H-binding [Auraticoccus monumenti]